MGRFTMAMGAWLDDCYVHEWDKYVHEWDKPQSTRATIARYGQTLCLSGLAPAAPVRPTVLIKCTYCGSQYPDYMDAKQCLGCGARSFEAVTS